MVRGFMGLAEQLGRFFVGLHDGLPDAIDMEYQGELAGEGTGILTLSVLKGIFGGSTEEPVSYVNAPQLAEQRGLQVRESSTATSHDYKSLITLRSGSHSVAGTLITAGLHTEPRIVIVDDHQVEVPPSDHMLVVRNDDRPGVIGIVGTALGTAGISISSMAVGPSPETTTAMMVISTTTPASDAVVDQLRGDEGILDIHRVTLVTRGRRVQEARLARDGRPRIEAADDGLVAVQLPARRPVEQDGAHHGQRPDDQGGAEQGREEPAHPTTVAWPAWPPCSTSPRSSPRPTWTPCGPTTRRSASPCTCTGAATARRPATASASTSSWCPTWGRPRSGAPPTWASTTPTRCTPSGGRRRWARPPTCSTPDSASWEAAHTDGDGNLLRFGSPVEP